jgi:hypothetical protein
MGVDPVNEEINVVKTDEPIDRRRNRARSIRQKPGDSGLFDLALFLLPIWLGSFLGCGTLAFPFQLDELLQ